MTQKRDELGRFKAAEPLTPIQARDDAVSSQRINEEVLRVNRALIRGVRRVVLNTLDEGCADKLVAVYLVAGWKVTSQWFKQRLYLVLREK